MAGSTHTIPEEINKAVPGPASLPILEVEAATVLARTVIVGVVAVGVGVVPEPATKFACRRLSITSTNRHDHLTVEAALLSVAELLAELAAAIVPLAVAAGFAVEAVVVGAAAAVAVQNPISPLL